jgi:hypothetical protein
MASLWKGLELALGRGNGLGGARVDLDRVSQRPGQPLKQDSTMWWLFSP